MAHTTAPHPRPLDERDPRRVACRHELPPDAEGSLLRGWLLDELTHPVADDDGIGGERPLPLEEVVEALRAVDRGTGGAR